MNEPPSFGAVTSAEFGRIRQVFEAALKREPDARPAFIESACSGNPLLIGEVQRMLAGHGERNSLLDSGEPAGTRLPTGTIFASHFHIIEAIGRGGMGEVFRARDTNLNRDVALKIVSHGFGRDFDGLARFKREAQLLASLNHPNIGAIYGFEESNGVQALVLELVDGPTLADRIARGALPIEEALPIALQIAEAVEAAHEHGVIHRDLKPGNVKLRLDGVVKVLDFGLAKALQPVDVVRRNLTDAATITSPAMTALGVILGTPAYMSPEQAKGKAVDRRADIWAFGALLYEMLTGRRAFPGDDISETLASVLRHEVDWTAIPSTATATLRTLMARCLERDTKRRLRDIGEARIVLDALITPVTGNARPELPTGSLAAVPPPRPLWLRAMPLVLVAIGAGLAGGAAAWFLKPSPPRAVSRLSFPLANVHALFRNRSAMAISPDGSQVVYATPSGLHLRPLSAVEPKIIPGTESFFNLTEPVFSPDGQMIAFHTGTDQTLKRIPVTGGAAVTICSATYPHSVSWGPAGILFVEIQTSAQQTVGSERIMRVSGNGGTPQLLIAFKTDESPHAPQVLPGGEHLLFSLAVGRAANRWDRARIVVQSLASGERRTVIEGGGDVRYVPTGHLVYAQGGSLFAVGFDLRRWVVTGPPVPVVDGISRAAADATGGAQFSFSSNGTLIYLANSTSAVQWLQRSQGTDIAIRDRHDKFEPLHLQPGRYEAPRVSPDGKRIVFTTEDGNEETVWLYELSGKGAMRRLTFGGHNRFPAWSSDGKRVAFQSDRDGDSAIFWQGIDSGKAERLTRPQPGEAHEPNAFSQNGEWLLFDVTKGADVELWKLSLADKKATPFGNVRSATRTGAVFHPDGHWVAYGSSEGRTIYVEPFPPNGVKYQLPSKNNRPNQPLWSPDGKEMFFGAGPGQFAFVTVTTKPVFMFGNTVVLPRRFGAPPLVRRPYDIMPDGNFVSTVQPGDAAAGQSEASRIQVVLNWFEDLRARVPITR
jgi:eukaryotic-like serine/threonine-protein kinase